MPRPHPPEFRRRAIALARERAKPIGELAKDLGISESACAAGTPATMQPGLTLHDNLYQWFYDAPDDSDRVGS